MFEVASGVLAFPEKFLEYSWNLDPPGYIPGIL